MNRQPLVYEINTRCWLHGLSEAGTDRVTLANVPDSEFARWQELGFTHIWLMGIWTTGPCSRAVALKDAGLRRKFPEVSPGDPTAVISASPYAIADYRVSRTLGGDAGLKTFRRRLHARRMRLLLDFVPNHVGLDHQWIRGLPDLFVQSAEGREGVFRHQTCTGARWLAHGRDPNFPPWADTAQLDYRRPDTQAAMRDVLLSIAGRCDGVRCDMAMLVLNDVFARTWAGFPSSSNAAQSEFWRDAIQATRIAHPDFLFLAEAYWGLEARLQSLGFDYTYDKVLYDEIIRRNPPGVQRHLLETPPRVLRASAHFLENHDEERIASILTPAEHRAAALLILALPGLRLLHDGELAGARFKVPVQFARTRAEPIRTEIAHMYHQMLAALEQTGAGREDAAIVAPRPAWPGNDTWQNFVLIQWQAAGPEFNLAVVNLTSHRSQCYAPLDVPDLGKRNWRMEDVLGPERYERDGSDLQAQALYLDAPEHAAQLFHFRPIA